MTSDRTGQCGHLASLYAIRAPQKHGPPNRISTLSTEHRLTHSSGVCNRRRPWTRPSDTRGKSNMQ